jgi:hypothetical protein
MCPSPRPSRASIGLTYTGEIHSPVTPIAANVPASISAVIPSKVPPARARGRRRIQRRPAVAAKPVRHHLIQQPVRPRLRRRPTNADARAAPCAPPRPPPSASACACPRASPGSSATHPAPRVDLRHVDPPRVDRRRFTPAAPSSAAAKRGRTRIVIGDRPPIHRQRRRRSPAPPAATPRGPPSRSRRSTAGCARRSVHPVLEHQIPVLPRRHLDRRRGPPATADRPTPATGSPAVPPVPAPDHRERRVLHARGAPTRRVAQCGPRRLVARAAAPASRVQRRRRPGACPQLREKDPYRQARADRACCRYNCQGLTPRATHRPTRSSSRLLEPARAVRRGPLARHPDRRRRRPQPPPLHSPPRPNRRRAPTPSWTTRRPSRSRPPRRRRSPRRPLLHLPNQRSRPRSPSTCPRRTPPRRPPGRRRPTSRSTGPPPRRPARRTPTSPPATPTASTSAPTAA